MRRPGWYWPWLLTVGMAGLVSVNVAMLVAANSDANGAVVEADYYHKAVTWDSTLARRARSDALGWRAEVRLAPRAGATPVVRVALIDADGRPVTGATVEAVLIHNADAAHPRAVTLPERAPGAYATGARLGRPGLWEVRVVATRGDDRFETDVRTDLAAESITAIR